MPHVVTQPCCADGSCVHACPVNCIHPTPDEPGFATSEMLHIDPAACVDCGACVPACPVGAIVDGNRLTPGQAPYAAINAAYYPSRPEGGRMPPATRLAPVTPAPRVRRSPVPLTVAIVGSGPAGMYAADELLNQDGVRVNVFDRLPTPYGLVRSGVAPDHPDTKSITRLFDRISRRPGFRFYLNVDIGRHLRHAELLAHHHAVLYALGASVGRPTGIAGMGGRGTGFGVDFVGWVNGHPDHTGYAPDLSDPRVVIIGNGNVALDVARILTAEPEALAGTDISEAALDALRRSEVREVVVAARRGPAESAFTLPELIGLTSAAEVVLDPWDRALVHADLQTVTDPVGRAKLEVLAGLPGPDPARRQIRLAYRMTPARVSGDGRGVDFVRAGAADTVPIAAGLVLACTGYRGAPVDGLPFDTAAAVVPNRGGRVVDPDAGRPVPGAYVAGWIKRGPSGFIGTNKSCAMQTVAALVDDFNSGLLAAPARPPAALDRFVRARQPALVDAAGWRAIDAAETIRGLACGRPRVKFTAVPDMLAAASAASVSMRESSWAGPRPGRRRR